MEKSHVHQIDRLNFVSPFLYPTSARRSDRNHRELNYTERRMNSKLSALYFGFVLFIAGCLAFGYTIGVVQLLTPVVCAALFSIVALFSTAFYLLNGVHNWSMLFPASIFTALAAFTLLKADNPVSPALMVPFLAAIALPFAIAFIVNYRKNWWGVLPISGLTLGAMVLISNQTTNQLALLAIGTLILAVSFAVIYFIRAFRWALGVAYGLVILAGILILQTSSLAILNAPVAIFAISLVYFYQYFTKGNKSAWTIIPAGLLATIAVLASLYYVGLLSLTSSGIRLASTLALLGMALTFSIHWFQSKQSWPGFIVFLLMCAIFTNQYIYSFEKAWPVIILFAGGYWFMRTLLKPVAQE